jgi:hypothetical protein
MKNDFENNCVLITDEEWVEAIPQRMKILETLTQNIE